MIKSFTSQNSQYPRPSNSTVGDKGRHTGFLGLGRNAEIGKNFTSLVWNAGSGIHRLTSIVNTKVCGLTLGFLL
jgi:hypothetical protein